MNWFPYVRLVSEKGGQPQSPREGLYFPLLREGFAVWLQLPTAALSATPARLVLHPSGLVDKVACKRVAGREAEWGGFSIDSAQLYVLVKSSLL